MNGLRAFSLLALMLPVGVLAQSPPSTVCTNETVAGISSRGIKVGIGLDEVLATFAKDEASKARLRNSPAGLKRRHLGFEFFGAEPLPSEVGVGGRFQGISSYTFSFVDGKLAGFGVRYVKPEWKNVEQFADTMSGLLRLPKIDPNNGLQCGDYMISVYAGQGSGGALSIEDRRLNALIQERDEKYKEDQRNADLKWFKP